MYPGVVMHCRNTPGRSGWSTSQTYISWSVVSGVATYEDTPCPTGHYCPAGTTRPYENPCPAGTYNPANRSTDVGDCIGCTPGYYCGSAGLEMPTDQCAPGWYCAGNSTSANTTTHGGECQPGYYCPRGSHTPTACDPGSYCPTAGLASPVGNCTEGRYTFQNSSNIESLVCILPHYGPEVAETRESACRLNWQF
jgi:hypothetical protein